MKAALFLTGACNLACTYCYASRCPAHPMTRETLAQSLEFLHRRSQGTLALTLIGGEPLLYPELVKEAVGLSRSWTDTLVSIAIATNGTLLDDDVLAFCQAQDLQLYLSLDGDQNAHDTHRRDRSGRGSYLEVVKRVPDILRAVPQTQVCAVITPETAGGVADSVECLLELGFRDISMGLNYSASWRAEDLDRLESQYQLAAKRYLDHHRKNLHYSLSFLDDHILTWTSGGTARSACCEMGDQVLAIGPSGRIYPCLQFVDADDGSQAIGDVRTGMDERARCRVLCHNRTPLAECQKCSLRERCFRWCGCTNWRATGNIYQPPAILCEHERRVIPLADAVAEQLYAERNPAFMRKFYGDWNGQTPRRQL